MLFNYFHFFLVTIILVKRFNTGKTYLKHKIKTCKYIFYEFEYILI